MTRELTAQEKRWITDANRVMKRIPKGLGLKCGYGDFGLGVIDNDYRREPLHPDADLGTISTPKSIILTD
jgi:hypothetical protein